MSKWGDFMRQRAALGSIKQLPDKRYKVTVTVGYTYDENGKKKQKRRSRIVNSMREAREMLQEYDREAYHIERADCWVFPNVRHKDLNTKDYAEYL